MTATAMPICRICHSAFEGAGSNPFPVTEGRCCDACYDTVVIPLRMERESAREGVQQVAQFVLALAVHRAGLSGGDINRIKELAQIAGAALLSNAVERLLHEHANPKPAPAGTYHKDGD